MERVLGRFAGEFYAFLRIVAGFLFACHGAQKLLGALGGHQAPLASQFGLAGIIEMVGGAMIAIGLFTSPVAFVASGEMAFAYSQAHAPKSFWPILMAASWRCLLLPVPLHGRARFRAVSVDRLVRGRSAALGGDGTATAPVPPTRALPSRRADPW